MNTNSIHWGAAVGGAVAGEVAQIIASIIWVAIYSYLINPGQPMDVYHKHAQVSGPWVSVFAGFVIFYLASRYIGRSVPTALALFAVFVVLDGVLMVLAKPQLTGQMMAIIALSFASKLLACYLGGSHAAGRVVAG
jgi:hypothetical protein